MTDRREQLGWANHELHLENERLLLCCLMTSPAARDDVLWQLRRDHFYADKHQRVFDAVQTLADRNEPIEPVTVATRLAESNDLQAAGGEEYLIAIFEKLYNAAHAGYYAKLVREQSVKRQAKYAAADVIEAVNADQPLADIITKAEATLGTVCESAIPATTIDMKSLILDVMADVTARYGEQRAVGMPTGFADLDQVLIGLNGGELIVVAARPGLGKTAFAVSMALQMAHAGKSILFFSLEMGKLEIGLRLLCSESGVNAETINTGFKNVPADDLEFEHDKLMRAASVLQKLPMHLDETPAQSMRAIASIARRTKRRHGLDVLFLDYIQLVEPEDKKAPREQQVATISRRLKALAKELGIPIIVLAQINRAVEARNNKKPMLSDLRESGAIEQDADRVLFLYREDYYSPGTNRGIAEVIIAKNRHGRTHPGIELGWIESRAKFVDRSEVLINRLPPSSNRLGPKTF